MLIAVFPGQGSQQIGMGRALSESFREARDVFAEIDEALKQKLSEIIFAGPEDSLQQTINTQPALMATSIAVVRVLEKQSGKNLSDFFSYLAGHSLGEYSALCAAGSITLTDTAKLLRTRGRAMQEAVPAGEGGMVALVGVEAETAQKISQTISAEVGVCEIANDNGGGQVVLSGVMSAIDAVVARAAEFGVRRAVKLPVSAPFHSSLIAPAAAVMREALSEVKISAPKIPVIANVTAREVSTADEIRALLVEQITGTVRWRESIDYLANKSVEEAAELGSGKVLSGLIKRIAPAIKTNSLSTPEEIDAWLASKL